jgi:hypothetical protein
MEGHCSTKVPLEIKRKEPRAGWPGEQTVSLTTQSLGRKPTQPEGQGKKKISITAAHC